MGTAGFVVGRWSPARAQGCDVSRVCFAAGAMYGYLLTDISPWSGHFRVSGSDKDSRNRLVAEVAAMIARIAVWEPMPDDDRQWVIDAAKTVPGVLDAYHLVDPTTGNGLSIAFFEDGTDPAAVKAAIGQRAEAIGWNDVPRPTPRSETIYRVIRNG